MWNSYPILRPTIAALLGMVGVNFLLTRIPFSIYITLGLLALTVATTAFLYRSQNRELHKTPFGLSALLAFFFLGATLAHWRYQHVESKAFDTHKWRTGVVVTEPVEKTKWWTCQFRDKDGTLHAAYLAKTDSLNHTRPDILVGDSLWILSYFEMPTSPYLKAKKQREMDEWKQKKEERKRKRKGGGVVAVSSADTVRTAADRSKYDGYSSYLFYKGVSSIIYSSEGSWGHYYRDGESAASFRRHLQSDKGIAAAMREQYDEAQFTEKAQVILEAMTTGDKSAMTPQLKQQFSDAGISHVLALSGFHLTVIVSLLDVLLLRGLFSRRWRKISALLILPCIWAFVFIVGAPPSLLRAALMCSAFQVAMVIGHGQQLKNAVALAGFVMLMINPMLIMDVGFQLSFLSIVGIAVMGVPLCTWCGRQTGRWSVVLDILIISFTCSLFTFPVVSYHFGQVPVYGLLSNLFVSLIATLIMWAAVFWWIFFWWGWMKGVLTAVLNFLTGAMAFVAEKVASLPLSTIPYHPSMAEVCLIYALIICLIAYFYNKKQRLLVASALLLCCIPVCHMIG